MKKISFALLFAVVASMTFTSCLVDDETLADTLDDGPNIVGFENSSTSASFPATGEDQTFYAKVRAIGPNLAEIKQPITVTVSVNEEATTAIEGVHYRPLAVTTFELSPGQNLMSAVPIEIITDGIDPPLAESPVLVLKIESISNQENLVLSGKQEEVSITINYLCFADLSGDYVMNYSSGPATYTVEKIADGKYTSNYFPGFPGDATGGFTFTNVCGQLTMLDWGYSNVITGVGHVDDATGNIVWDAVTVEGVSGYVNLSWVMIKQ